MWDRSRVTGTLTIDKSTIEKRFGAKFYIAQASYDWMPAYNAAPSQMLPIMRAHHPDRIEFAKWGFWPEEWKRTKTSHPMINARLETAAEKPMFASSFHGRHCLVLADGYYEWRTVGGRKQPYRITLKSGEPFAMAGIYAREPTEFDTDDLDSLGRERQWLQPNPTGQFFMPEIPPELLTSYPVTPKINKSTFNAPEAIAPARTHDTTSAKPRTHR
jgi:putative SOS response-associated peptidase YedK